MAVGGKVSFNSWLSSYLSERSIDVDVYLEYICGITHTSGEGDEEELVSSLEEVLSGAVDASGNSSGVVKAIVDKWKELILSDTSTVQAVEDSGTNMLSEIHDKILSSAAQDRQGTGTTAPIAHSQLDSLEKQRMIKAYGNLVEEDEDCTEGAGASPGSSTSSADLLPNVNTRLVVEEQRKVKERRKQEHEAKVERDKQSRQKQLQKEQDRKEKEKKRTQKQERRR